MKVALAGASRSTSRPARSGNVSASIAGAILLSEHIEEDGLMVFRHACRLGRKRRNRFEAPRCALPLGSGEVGRYQKPGAPGNDASVDALPDRK